MEVSLTLLCLALVGRGERMIDQANCLFRFESYGCNAQNIQRGEEMCEEMGEEMSQTELMIKVVGVVEETQDWIDSTIEDSERPFTLASRPTVSCFFTAECTEIYIDSHLLWSSEFDDEENLRKDYLVDAWLEIVSLNFIFCKEREGAKRKEEPNKEGS